MMALLPVQSLLFEAVFDPRRTPAQQVEAAHRFWLSIRSAGPDAELEEALDKLALRMLRIADDPESTAPVDVRARADRLMVEMTSTQVRSTRPAASNHGIPHLTGV